jgi:pimeloyl-ACP methyl ester carboxylesterase
VEAENAAPTLNLYMLHGIYGRGRNWAGVARAVVAARPEWRGVLIDLRGHGDSPPLPAPHGVIDAAADVTRTAEGRGETLHALLGHSFGGKVALAVAATAPASLRAVWVIDASPAPQSSDGSAARMLAMARRHRGPFASREEVVRAIEGDGFAPSVAAWMASNVVRRGDEFVWRLDFDVMEALLEDFNRTDLWGVVEAPPPGVTLHFVRATSSALLDDAARARIAAAHRRHGRAHLHEVEGGHWLNADNPEALVALLVGALPQRDA